MRRREFLGTIGAGVGAALVPGSLWSSSVGWYRSAVVPPYGHFIERWSWAMGQPVHLQLFARSEAQGYDAAGAALAELRRVEQRLSLFDDASDLAELNRHAGRRGMRVDRDLALVLSASLRLQAATRGAFNPAVEPLMRAWGFRAPRPTEPTAGEIAEARQAVSAARVILRAGNVSLPSAHTRLDLGGIGVGYGIDCAMSVLRRRGISRAFLDVSGDCFALGTPPGETGWLVEIAGPQKDGRIIAATRLSNAALATSANTMSVVQYGRAIRGQVMNPATGWPADALTQTTVVSASGIDADALSTGMLVSGRPAEGVQRYYRLPPSRRISRLSPDPYWHPGPLPVETGLFGLPVLR